MKARRAEPAGEEPDDDLETNPAVLAALRSLESPKTNWQQGLLILAVTAALFVWAQHARGTTAWLEIVLLVVVLLLHELGHLAAMQLFGYRDLRIFFLPFFGAAASGRKLHATATQRALVSLAGPVPSLVLAVALCFGAAAVGQPLNPSSSEPFPRFVLLLFVVNTLNLLPIEPLDGGAFVRVVLMARVPLLQVGFRAIAGLALVGLALAFKDLVWVMFAVFLLTSCPRQYALAKSARRLRRELKAAGVRSRSDAIPDEQIDRVARRVRIDLKVSEPRGIAASMHALWQQAHERSPRWGATIGLLALYTAFVVPAAVLAFALPRPSAAADDPRTEPDVIVVFDAPQFLGPDDPLPADLLANRLQLPKGWRPAVVVRTQPGEPAVEYVGPDEMYARLEIMRTDSIDAGAPDPAAIVATWLRVRGAAEGATRFDSGVPGADAFQAGADTTITVLRTGDLLYVLKIGFFEELPADQAQARTREVLRAVRVR